MMTRAPLSFLCAAILSWWAAPAFAVEVTPAPPPAADRPATVWVGYAVSPSGRVFSEESAEEQRARVFARHECERATGTSCRAIAVPKSWKVSAVQCGGTGFVAGLPTGSALPLARQKAVFAHVRAPCRQVFAR